MVGDVSQLMVTELRGCTAWIFHPEILLLFFMWFATGCTVSKPPTLPWVCPEPVCKDWELLLSTYQGIPLVGFRKPGGSEVNRLIVYIEGDGKGWLSRSRLSNNPTPADPIGLRLAIRDSRPGLFYLARPCQYVHPDTLERCSPSLWSTARYSKHVIEAMSHAVTAAKRAQSDRLTLVGYSGGGVIAVLLAAHRLDVDRLITIAAPLDTEAWVKYHSVSPIVESLNPLETATATGSVSEFHFHGEQDQIVPPEVIKKYAHRANRAGVRFFTMPGYDHSCCWVRDWQELLALTDESGP